MLKGQYDNIKVQSKLKAKILSIGKKAGSARQLRTKLEML